MSAYRQILYHIVFRTKNSEKTINQVPFIELKKYIWGIIKNSCASLARGYSHLSPTVIYFYPYTSSSGVAQGYSSFTPTAINIRKNYDSLLNFF